MGGGSEGNNICVSLGRGCVTVCVAFSVTFPCQDNTAFRADVGRATGVQTQSLAETNLCLRK